MAEQQHLVHFLSPLRPTIALSSSPTSDLPTTALTPTLTPTITLTLTPTPDPDPGPGPGPSPGPGPGPDHDPGPGPGPGPDPDPGPNPDPVPDPDPSPSPGQATHLRLCEIACASSAELIVVLAEAASEALVTLTPTLPTDY